jgi:hypothetical protein
MANPHTPNCPQGARNADFTQPLDPNTPSHCFLGKKPRAELHLQAPPALANGDKKRVTHETANALNKGIEAANRRAKLEVRLMTELAQLTDNWVSSYESTEERLLAGCLSRAVSDALITRFNNTTPNSPPPSSRGSYASAVSSNMPSITNDKATGSQRCAGIKASPLKSTGASRDDTRVLVTVPTETLLAGRAEPYMLRKALADRIPELTMAKIITVTPTKTGWAIVPDTLATRDVLLKEPAKTAIIEIFRGTTVAAPETWYNYVVPLIPSAFHSLMGGEMVLVDENLVKEEALTQTGSTPVRVEPSKAGINPATGKQSWIVSFTTQVRPFYLFSTDSKSVFIPKKASLKVHDHGCQGWCNPVKCTRLRRCNNCGSTGEKHPGPMDARCTYETKCANCLGPFKAGHNNCPAAPVRKGGRLIRQTKKELRSIRAAGIRATQAARGATPEFSTPESSNGGAQLGADVSPSPSPASTTKRPRAEDTRYENAGSTPSPLTNARPLRSTAPTKSMNERTLMATHIEEGRRSASQPQPKHSNRFGALQVTSATEPEDDDDMIDANTH